MLSDLLPQECEIQQEPDLSPVTENEDAVDHTNLSAVCAVSPCSLLVKQYSLRHNLTQAALADLIQLLRLNSSTPDVLLPSVCLFEKQFQSLHYPLKIHYFCSVCLQLLPSSQIHQCPNDVCKTSFATVGAISSFIELPIELQLANMMRRK